jgi:hypothetical protein
VRSGVVDEDDNDDEDDDGGDDDDDDEVVCVEFDDARREGSRWATLGGLKITCQQRQLIKVYHFACLGTIK